MPANRQKQQHPVSTSHWHLVLVDETPIRRSAVLNYRAAERSLAALRADIETFETREIPAYHEWEALTFGALLTEIREARSAAESIAILLDEVQREAYFSDCSEVTAYRRVMDARQRGVPLHDDEREGYRSDDFPDPESTGGKLFGDTDLPPDFDIDAFDAQSKRRQSEFREQYDFMADIFEATTGRTVPPLDDLLDQARFTDRNESSPPPPQSATEPAKPLDQRLKSLYRKLVQALHPDRNSALTPRQRELWHEVQAAYQDRDLERLEAAAGRVELGTTGDADNLPVATLLRMTAELIRATAELTRAVSRARRHPAWGFRKTTKKRSRIESRRRQELEREYSRVTEDLRALTVARDDLDRRSKRAKRPSSQKR